MFLWLFIFNVLDVVTGFTKAFINKTISSHKMKKSLPSKISIWVVILITNFLDMYMNTHLESAVIIFYIFMEIISILENIDEWTTIPTQLTTFLSNRKEDK